MIYAYWLFVVVYNVAKVVKGMLKQAIPYLHGLALGLGIIKLHTLASLSDRVPLLLRIRKKLIQDHTWLLIKLEYLFKCIIEKGHKSVPKFTQ